MAASATGGRPRSTRGGSAKTNLAYDLGRKGEAAPAWIGDEPDYADAYENGVSERDANGGDTPPTRPQAAKKTTKHKPSRPAAARKPAPASNVVPIRPDTPTEPEPASAPRGVTSTLIASTGGSIGSAILGALAYGLFINVVKGTGTQWIKAKATNGDGQLP